MILYSLSSHSQMINIETFAWIFIHFLFTVNVKYCNFVWLTVFTFFSQSNVKYCNFVYFCPHFLFAVKCQVLQLCLCVILSSVSFNSQMSSIATLCDFVFTFFSLSNVKYCNFVFVWFCLQFLFAVKCQVLQLCLLLSPLYFPVKPSRSLCRGSTSAWPRR